LFETVLPKVLSLITHLISYLSTLIVH